MSPLCLRAVLALLAVLGEASGESCEEVTKKSIAQGLSQVSRPHPPLSDTLREALSRRGWGSRILRGSLPGSGLCVTLASDFMEHAASLLTNMFSALACEKGDMLY